MNDPNYETLARIEVIAPISIVVPTYKECENIPHLITRIDALRLREKLTIELLFLDDQSRDGSAEAVAACGLDWVRFIERTGQRGLSVAVLDGLEIARHPVIVCMDCDLSHPPETLPRMVLALSSGAEFVIGSRYVPGGSTDDDWGFFRWLNSRVATLLARPLTHVRDPMSGFFALRKEDFDRSEALNPVGYKIALELIVKCDFRNVAEVPIHFTDRVYGESKLSLKEQLLFLKHLRRLYLHKFTNAMHVLQFAVVGASGVVVNMAVLTLAIVLGAPPRGALIAGVLVSLITNFLLNRRFTFSYARDQKILSQFAGFLATSLIGLVVNYGVSVYALENVLPSNRWSIYLAAVMGILSGMTFNFLGNRYVVFRKRHVKK